MPIVPDSHSPDSHGWYSWSSLVLAAKLPCIDPIENVDSVAQRVVLVKSFGNKP
jgi:hypothetical protein